MTVLPEYKACELCPQTRSCRFCDFEALKATVENRPWPNKYIRTAEGYKLVISFEKDNLPPNSVKGANVVMQFGRMDSEKVKEQSLDVLSAFMKSDVEITAEIRAWLAELLSTKSNSLCQLRISSRSQGARSKDGVIKHQMAIQEYKQLLVSGNDSQTPLCCSISSRLQVLYKRR